MKKFKIAIMGGTAMATTTEDALVSSMIDMRTIMYDGEVANVAARSKLATQIRAGKLDANIEMVGDVLWFESPNYEDVLLEQIFGDREVA